MVITAMVERPHEINTALGNLGAVAHTLAPKAGVPGAAPGLPGVPRLRRGQGRGRPARPASREQIMLAKLFKGVHW